MVNSYIPDKIKNSIIDSNKFISSDDLTSEFNITKRTASNYLSRLEREGLITRIGRGKYLNSQKTKLKLEIDPEIKKIHSIIKESSPFLNFVIWSIFNLKNFFHNIPIKNYIFIEAEEFFELKSIKERLFELNIESIIKPKSIDFEEILYRKEIPIILFRRKNQYGIIKLEEIETPISERIVLDLYYYITRKHLNYPSEELRDILISMIQTGEFNFSFAMRYAQMRNFNFELLFILLKLQSEFPDYIPSKYLRKIKEAEKNLNLFFGKGWANGIL